MSSVPLAAIPPAGASVGDAARRDGRAGGDVDLSTETVDELVERVRLLAARAVDALQVAASLESDGITDEIARSQYGYPDVFVLAAEVRRRATSRASPPAPFRIPAQESSPALRDVSHGLLYLLPAAIFPAVLAVLERRSLVLGLVLAGGIGWVWAGGATWMAYRLLGRGHAGTAARALRWSALAGLPVAAAASLVVVATTRAGHALVAMATAQMAYQMAAALLMIYRREIWLFAGMAPAVAAGGAYLVEGDRLLAPAVTVGAISVLSVFGVALWQTRGVGDGRAARVRDGLTGELAQLPLVLLYTALSAAFLLHAQARYMLGRFDIVVAYLPLIVGMGVVEWRARRFGDASRSLLHGVTHPGDFVAGVRVLLARDLALCFGVAAAGAAVLVAALHAADRLTLAAGLMTAASVLLAGTYFAGFLLANMARFAWLSGSLATGIALHVGLMVAVPGGLDPVQDTAVFLTSSLLLFLLLLMALAGCVGQARYHR